MTNADPTPNFDAYEIEQMEQARRDLKARFYESGIASRAAMKTQATKALKMHVAPVRLEAARDQIVNQLMGA